MSRFSWGILPDIATDSSTITRETLPPGYSQFYVNASETRVFFNINNSITSLNCRDVAEFSLTGKTQNSVELSSNKLQLVGDTASPGNSKYYGTDGGGTKGFFDLAIAGMMAYTDSRLAIGTVNPTTTTVAGLGFEPKAVIFLAVAQQRNRIGFGLDNGTNRFSVGQEANETWVGTTSYGIRWNSTPAADAQGYISAMDSDGFTMYWENGTNSDTVLYMAFR